jgi:hypothetical protein
MLFKLCPRRAAKSSLLGLFVAAATLSAAAHPVGKSHAADADTAVPVGTRNVTVADPTVPRPPGQPCVAMLFSGDVFNDFSSRPFSYAPPSCPGPWAKVVLEADFSVTAGRQFDRTASIWLGGVNLYFGTTQEPSATVSPSWHVERDLTDYANLFRQPGNGQAVLGNLVNSTYTGLISGSAKLLFYPATPRTKAPQVADRVIAMGSDPLGATTTLQTPTDQLAQTLTLPRNVERAYLDVFLQAQSNDEFSWSCVPDQYSAQTQDCGGGNYREGQVSIDGQAAGVVPVVPWVFTGGVDPYLWRPTPGVQTLNFMPYRVDLTPFAGVLSDGQPHTVALSVAGANHYFSTSATLLLYQDPHGAFVSGSVTRNTLAGQAAAPVISDTLSTDASGNVSGAVNTRLSRHFVIEGIANTSHGQVRTTVDQTVSFANTQTFNITASVYGQVSDQMSSVSSVSRSLVGQVLVGEFQQTASYPLHMDYLFSNVDYSQQAKTHLGYSSATARRQAGSALYSERVDNTVDASDTLLFSPSFSVIGHKDQQSQQSFRYGDSMGGCYSADVASVGGAVTSYASGSACPAGKNRVWWFSHPDGSPDSDLTLRP